MDLTDNGHLYNGLISIELNDKFEIQWRDLAFGAKMEMTDSKANTDIFIL